MVPYAGIRAVRHPSAVPGGQEGKPLGLHGEVPLAMQLPRLAHNLFLVLLGSLEESARQLR